jgi:hypothetical protein
MTKSVRNLVMAFVVAVGAAGAMASPALAADWHHGRDARAHEWRDHYRGGYGWAPYAYAAPAYGYYGGYYGGYVPAPVPYAPVGSFSLSIPLAIR